MSPYTLHTRLLDSRQASEYLGRSILEAMVFLAIGTDEAIQGAANIPECAMVHIMRPQKLMALKPTKIKAQSRHRDILRLRRHVSAMVHP